MNELILLTGATGYVGGRLLNELQRRGRRIRCLARNPDALASRISGATEVTRGDLFDEASLDAAMAGVHTAYYLVHSMGSGADYADLDRRAAAGFGRAARRAGVRRIVYLGGLADPSADLSRHLRSRIETGDSLRESGVPVLEFRASIVIGAGSLSFEMVRSLVDRLPVMEWPRWVRTDAQPIGVDDLLAYLVAALDRPNPGRHAVFEIGGADVASYGDLMREYARQRGLRRLMLPVPLLTPWLSSLWLGLVTPVYARVGRELVGGVRNRSVVLDPSALRAFPITPIGMRDAIARAIASEAPATESSWSDARSSSRPPRSWREAELSPPVIESREMRVPVPPAAAFEPIQRIGGQRGWYFADALWTIRGWIDLLAGGAGLRRGRRDPRALRVGDALDFWRVESFEPGRRLRLQAEMRLPGRAWLEFEPAPAGAGGARIRQTATFAPAGLAGKLYWYALWPIHTVMFRGMLRGIGRAAVRGSGPPGPSAGERVEWGRCLPFLGIHALCLGALWAGVSAIALAVAGALYVLRVFAITAFYHRYFSHRTFRTSRPFQLVMAVAGNTAAQRGPIWWAAHHRHHHLHAERHPDLHSPVGHPFWRSHLLWFMTGEGFRTQTRYVRDLLRYPELRALDRFDWVAPAALPGALAALGAALEHSAPTLATSAAQMVVWGFAISTVAVYHATYTIKSLAHRWGRRRFATADDSRNNAVLALVTLGEGWHNNHHHYPASARQEFYWWEIDLAYYGLRVLSWLGLIWDLRPVPRHVLTRNLIVPEAA